MHVQPLPSRPLAAEAAVEAAPKIPAFVLTAWKGGTWKTSLAVSLAERLAFAGLRVGLLATDSQQDARARLGIRPSDADPASAPRGNGVVICAGLGGPEAADVLYRRPDRFGPLDLAVVDTAPSRRGMRLPGTVLVVPVFDADSARNNVAALLDAPASCRIVLVKTGAKLDPADWRCDVAVIGEALGRHVLYVPGPLPASHAVADAHAAGRSVWSLSRRGAVKAFLEGIEVLAETAWRHAGRTDALPDAPPSGSVEAFIPGWDDARDDD